MTTQRAFALLLASAALSATSANAAVVVSSNYNTTSRTFYSVSNSDLINDDSAFLTAGPTYTGYTQLVSTGLEFNPENINDGSNSNVNGSIVQQNPTAALGTEVFSVDFSLGNNPNGNFGFDINSITITSNGGDRRVNQDIEVFASLVGSSDFITIHRYQYTPNEGTSGTFSAQAALTQNAGNFLLASGVDALRFTTYVASGGSAGVANTVWAEFDVQGIAAVPEPSTFVLLALALVGTFTLFCRRRMI